MAKMQRLVCKQKAYLLMGRRVTHFSPNCNPSYWIESLFTFFILNIQEQFSTEYNKLLWKEATRNYHARALEIPANICQVKM